MTRNLWISIVAAIALIAGSGVSHMAEISYLPSILMFIAAVTVLGVSMVEEDKEVFEKAYAGYWR